MADQILTLAQLNSAFQSLTATLTGLDPNSGVRLRWPTNGVPGWGVAADVAFMSVTTSNEPIIQQRETDYQGDAGDGVNVNVQDSYSRVHEVSWMIVGPNSYANAEALRSGLYSQSAHDTLAALNLFMVLDVPAVTRVPELFNGQWWERCDISARFNEAVARAYTVPYLVSSQVTVIDDSGDQEVIS